MRGLPSSASSFVDGVGENTKGMLQLVPFLFDSEQSPGGQSSGSSRSGDDMVPHGSIARLSAKASAMDSLLDVRNPALNSAIDGVLKIGGVGAAHAATQEAYSLMRKGTKANRSSSSPIRNSLGLPVARSLVCNICGLGDDAEAPTRRDLEKIVYKAGKEGLQWGMVAGMYAGLEYGMEKARGGKQDWKNAAVGGALTGAIISVSDGRISQDKMVRTALTASALATAADFLKLTATIATLFGTCWLTTHVSTVKRLG